MSGAHARIGPSALARVRRCPGSVRATDGLPDRTTEAAAEGTVLHEIAADCLEFGFEPEDYVGRTMSADGYTFKIGMGDNEVDPTCMGDALDWIREQPGELFVEQRLQLDPWMPEQFGTGDVGIYTPELLTVGDWKFGAGVLVEVRNNDQARAYALGFVNLLRKRGRPLPPRISIFIEQPRCPGGARFHMPWEITLDELLAFGEEAKEIVARAKDPDAPRAAGLKQCHFCAAKEQPGGCYAHNEFMLDLMGSKFDDLDEDIAATRAPALSDPHLITPERRTHLIRHSSMVKRWFAQLEESALDDAIAGNPVPGLKAVAGQKGNRKWGDEESVTPLLEGSLSAEAFTKKLISPAQAEKKLKPRRGFSGDPDAWEGLRKLITQDDGKPILVDESDERPALKSVDDKFDDDPLT